MPIKLEDFDIELANKLSSCAKLRKQEADKKARNVHRSFISSLRYSWARITQTVTYSQFINEVWGDCRALARSHTEGYFMDGIDNNGRFGSYKDWAQNKEVAWNFNYFYLRCLLFAFDVFPQPECEAEFLSWLNEMNKLVMHGRSYAVAKYPILEAYNIQLLKHFNIRLTIPLESELVVMRSNFNRYDATKAEEDIDTLHRHTEFISIKIKEKDIQLKKQLAQKLNLIELQANTIKDTFTATESAFHILSLRKSTGQLVNLDEALHSTMESIIQVNNQAKSVEKALNEVIQFTDTDLPPKN